MGTRRAGRGEIGETRTTPRFLPVPSAGIEPATLGLGTGAQLDEAASDLRDVSTTFDKGRNAKGELERSVGKVAAGTTSLWP